MRIIIAVGYIAFAGYRHKLHTDYPNKAINIFTRLLYSYIDPLYHIWRKYELQIRFVQIYLDAVKYAEREAR